MCVNYTHICLFSLKECWSVFPLRKKKGKKRRLVVFPETSVDSGRERGERNTHREGDRERDGGERASIHI